MNVAKDFLVNTMHHIDIFERVTLDPDMQKKFLVV
jgi:hypothetical protein